MIICHRYRFIFIKTRKTAGTSIEIALSRFCGENDVITPILEEDERLRQRLGYPGPRNYRLSLAEMARLAGWKEWARFLLTGRRKMYWNHMPAGAVRHMVGEEIWNDYFTFCFERNPWDKVISYYWWRKANGDDLPDLSEFILQGGGRKVSDYDRYTENGALLVDRVCRFENLASDLEEIGTLLNLPEALELPHTKSGTRKDRRNYRELLGEPERDRIAADFAREIALLDYTF